MTHMSAGNKVYWICWMFVITIIALLFETPQRAWCSIHIFLPTPDGWKRIHFKKILDNFFWLYSILSRFWPTWTFFLIWSLAWTTWPEPMEPMCKLTVRLGRSYKCNTKYAGSCGQRLYKLLMLIYYLSFSELSLALNKEGLWLTKTDTQPERTLRWATHLAGHDTHLL